MLTAAEVKEYAVRCGADLVGIGDIQRYEGAPPQYDPRYILPEAKVIIGFGFRIHRGVFRGIEEGTFFAGYPGMGYSSINDVYAPIVLREVANLLEDHGYEAVMYTNTMVRPGLGQGRPVAPGKPRPDIFLHFRIAAFICGLGQIGYNKLLLTKRFGPRQRLAFIITDAPLQPDPLIEESICDRCMLCVKECPAGLISPDKTEKVTVAGREIEWGQLDEPRCALLNWTGTPETNPFLPPDFAELVGRVLRKPPYPLLDRGLAELIQKMQKEEPGRIDDWSLYVMEKLPYARRCYEAFHYPPVFCGARGCIRACMMHLEEIGKIENTFQAPFRRRPPWTLEG
ncbi:MAG: (4Fe-4S)-binding protein [Moorellales bacterium]